MIRICPRCKHIANYNYYFNAYVCEACSYQIKEKKENITFRVSPVKLPRNIRLSAK